LKPAEYTPVHNIVYLAVVLATIAGAIALWKFANKPVSRPMQILLVIGLILFAALNFKISWTSAAFYDFTDVYYLAGKAALQGDASSLRALTGNGVMGFVNIPVVAYFFAPFALFSPQVAAALITMIGLVLVVASWALLVRLAELKSNEAWLLAFLFLANGPLVNGIKWGNASYIILFTLTLALYLIRQNRSAAAGVILGLSAVIKPSLVLFGIFFLLRRDVRGVAGFAAACVSVACLSLLLFGWENNLYWFEACIVRFSHNWLAAFTTQSVAGFIFRLNASPDVLLNWLPHTPSKAQQLFAQIITGCLFLITAAACLRRQRGPAELRDDKQNAVRRDLQFAVTICLCLLTSPLTWSHYYAWLLIPVAFVLKLQSSLPSVARWTGWIATTLVTIPVALPMSFSSPILMRLYSATVASHLLVGGLLWFGLLAWMLSRAGGLLAPLSENSGQDLVLG
jgi:alpha-1,2-mannosyltransferase